MNKLQYLPKCEIIFFFTIYLFYLIYAIYHVFLIRDEIRSKSVYNGFEPGWKILGRPRDNMDFEWERWKIFIWDTLPWFGVHTVLSEMARIYNKKTLPLIHAIIGNLFIFFHFNCFVFVGFLFKNLLYYWITLRFRSNRCIWALTIFWLIGLNLMKSATIKDFLETVYDGHFQLSTDDCFEIIIIFAWNLLKCISFSFDKIKCDGDKSNLDIPSSYSLSDFLGYTYYFPTLFLGPVMIYERHKTKMANNLVNGNSASERLNRFTCLLCDVAMCAFWMFFTEFCLHYIYINNLLWNPELVETLNPWALYGMGYIMGQFFHHKYVVAYGLGIAFAKWDNIDAPNKPKCIGRIHLYSDMWKYFDQGLYEFLLKYIYKNLVKSRPSFVQRILSSFITFAFIYLWHGFYQYILIWTISNYVCLVIEVTGQAIARSDTYKKYFFKGFAELRVIGILGSQLFIPSAISNFYFFAGVEVGNIFVRKTYIDNNWVNYALLTICCTSIYHASEIVKRYERYYEKLIKAKK